MSTPVKFEDPADIKWKWRAEEVQQYYCDSLSDRTWELYEVKEYMYVAKKVAFAIFGLPKDDNIDEYGLEGYDVKQREIANKIKDKIVEIKPSDMDLHIAFLFLCCKIDDKEFPEPVFRVLRSTTSDGDDTSWYVDTCGRVYTDWDKFLANNILPSCLFCYPERGWYEYNCDEPSTVRLAFAWSPACSLGQKARRVGDTAGTALSFVAAGVGLATLFTPVAPIIAIGAIATGTLSGVYGGFRGAETVYDRKAHGQSISLADSEARGVWLNIAVTALGTVAGAANAALLASAKAGEVFSKSARAAINVLNISNVSVNGVVIADRLVYMVDKYKNGKLTTLDILQFSVSVFFFTNSLISIKMARTMIKDAQAEVINSHQETLPSENLPGFRKEVKATRNQARSAMYGNSRVIKRIQKVDTDVLSPSIATRPLNLAGDGNEEEKKATLLSPSVAGIPFPMDTSASRNTMPVTPTQSGTSRMFQVFCEAVGTGFGIIQAGMGATRRLDDICRLPGIELFRGNINAFIDNVLRAFNSKKWSELEINGVRIFENLHPFEQSNLGSIMGAEGNNFDPEITNAALTVAKHQKCTNSTEFVSVLNQTSNYVNQNAPSPVIRNLLLTDLKNPKSDSFKDLASRFETTSESLAMTFHFYRYNDETRELSQFEEHLKICRELFGEEVNSSNAIFSEASQDTVTVTYLNEKNVAYAVVIEHIPHGTEITYFKATVSILPE